MLSKKVYAQRAQKFLQQTDTVFSIRYKACEPNIFGVIKHRYIFTLSNPRGHWEFIYNSARKNNPGSFDVLSTISLFDPGTLAEFCEYLSAPDNADVRLLYDHIKTQWDNMNRLFTPHQLSVLLQINMDDWTHVYF